MTQQRVGSALGIGALLLIASATLFPDLQAAYRASQTQPWCILCGSNGAVDFTLNVILFLPLGIALGLLGWRPYVILMAGIGLTLSIETAQALVITGRDASLGDLLANTSGAWIGGILGRSWTTWLVPTPMAARRLTGTAIGIWLLIHLFTAWALQPSAPDGQYFGQWQPQLQGMDVFDGTVLEAFLNRLPLPQGPALHSGEFQRESRATVSSLATMVISGRQTSRFAPIIAVAHTDKYHVVSLGQAGRDIVHYRRFRASDLRLRSPAFHLDNGLPWGPGDSVHIVGLRDGNTISITAESSSMERTVQLALSPSMGWTLLNPFDNPLGPNVDVGNALWLAGWLALVGWWSRFALDGASARLLLFLGAALTGLLVIPLATGYAIATWTDWIGAAMGWLAAILLAGLAHQHHGARDSMTTGVNQD